MDRRTRNVQGVYVNRFLLRSAGFGQDAYAKGMEGSMQPFCIDLHCNLTESLYLA